MIQRICFTLACTDINKCIPIPSTSKFRTGLAYIAKSQHEFDVNSQIELDYYDNQERYLIESNLFGDDQPRVDNREMLNNNIMEDNLHPSESAQFTKSASIASNNIKYSKDIQQSIPLDIIKPSQVQPNGKAHQITPNLESALQILNSDTNIIHHLYNELIGKKRLLDTQNLPMTARPSTEASVVINNQATLQVQKNFKPIYSTEILTNNKAQPFVIFINPTGGEYKNTSTNDKVIKTSPLTYLGTEVANNKFITSQMKLSPFASSESVSPISGKNSKGINLQEFYRMFTAFTESLSSATSQKTSSDVSVDVSNYQKKKNFLKDALNVLAPNNEDGGKSSEKYIDKLTSFFNTENVSDPEGLSLQSSLKSYLSQFSKDNDKKLTQMVSALGSLHKDMDELKLNYRKQNSTKPKKSMKTKPVIQIRLMKDTWMQ